MAKFKVGDHVEVLDGTFTVNHKGDKGIVVEYDPSDNTYRVEVEGRRNRGNWMNPEQFVKIRKPRKSKAEKVPAVEQVVETGRTSENLAKELVIGKEYYFDETTNSYGKLVQFDELGDPEFELIENEGGFACYGKQELAPFFNIPLQDFWEKV